MEKKKIEYKFDIASSTYDSVASIQKQCAKFLTAQLFYALPDFLPKTILDLGTGTGYATDCLLEEFPDSYYLLNDISLNMLKIVKSKFSTNEQISFYHGDLETNDFAPHDLTISNFALQWVEDLEAVIAKFYHGSNCFAFSCLLNGTFKTWENILRYHEIPSPLKSYPNNEKLMDFILSLRPQKYYFIAQNFDLKFFSIMLFINYLKKLGATVGSSNISLKDLKNIIKLHKGPLIIRYNVFFCIIER